MSPAGTMMPKPNREESIPSMQRTLAIMKITCPGIQLELRLSAPDDEGWMHPVVLVKVPSFEGMFRCAIEKEEWKAFVRGLHDLESSIGSEVSWNNMEDNIELRLSVDRSGAVHGAYRFSPENFSLGPVLSGSFEADQTYLREWSRSASEDPEHAR
jgi:hypothetical protein